MDRLKVDNVKAVDVEEIISDPESTIGSALEIISVQDLLVLFVFYYYYGKLVPVII